MKLRKAYRYAIAPTKAQEAALQSWEGPLRFLWNWMLKQRQDAYKGSEGRVKVYYEEQQNQLPPLKKQYPFLCAVPHHVLQSCLRDLDRAFVNFFEGRAKYPKLKRKSKGDRPGMSFPDPAQFRIVGPHVTLPKLGSVKMRLSRRVEGKPKTATITHDGLRWQVSIQTESEVAEPASRTDAPLGVDVGVANSLALTTRKMHRLPVATDTEEKRLAKLARAISRKKSGSKRHAKAKRRRLKYARHIQNRVKDARHKLTTMLAKEHGVIAVEDLNLKGMTASAAGSAEAPGANVAAKAGLNKALLEQGHFETFRQLEYKLAHSGGRFVRVDPARTSQTCPDPKCRHCAPENRKSQAVFLCVKCGHADHADFVGADNILGRALSPPSPAAERAVAARGGNPSGSRRNANLGKRPVASLRREPLPPSSGIPGLKAR